MAEEKKKRENGYAYLAKLWKTKNGKLKVIAIICGFFVMTVAAQVVGHYLGKAAYEGANPQTVDAYELTDSQIADGYVMSVSSSGTNNQAAWRYMTDAEEQATSPCSSEIGCWDIKVLATSRSCAALRIQWSTYETEAKGTAIETGDKLLKAPASAKFFTPGEESIFRIEANDPKTAYLSIDNVICSAE